MITIRPSKARGHFNFGWLDTRHTFSFGDYVDHAHMGFRNLRVINEDVVQPTRGFGTHPHRDMEILTWVLSGSLAHRDSSGHSGIIVPGDAQRMTAGRGIAHSEINPSGDKEVHLLQIWLKPERRDLEPGYEQRHFPEDARRNRLGLLASPGGRDGSLHWNTEADLYDVLLEPDQRVELPLAPGRGAWVQVARGKVEVNGKALKAGDGAALEGEPAVAIRALAHAEVLLFDLRGA